MIPVNRPRILKQDIDSVLQALQAELISGHSKVIENTEEHLANFLGTQYAVLANSGTSAIDLTVEALNIKQDDECVVPAFTIMSTVNSLLRKRAKLKLVDVSLDTWCLDVDETLEVITSNTKLLIPVHIYGLTVDVQRLRLSTQTEECSIVEDAAESLGTLVNGRWSGTVGDAGVFSFYANKIVTCGEGGAIVTSDKELATKLRYFRNLCFNPEQRFVHSDLGWNYRLSSIQAAMLPPQLNRLSESVNIKLELAQRYINNLHNHPWFRFQAAQTDWCRNSYWVVGVLLTDDCPYTVSEISNHLLQLGIETRRFFCPVHLQPIVKKLGIEFEGDFKNSEKLWERGLYLPSGLGITLSEVDTVSEILWSLEAQT